MRPSLEHRCKYNYWTAQESEMASRKSIEVLPVRVVAWMVVANRKNSLVAAQEREDYKNNHFDSAAFGVFPIIQLVC